MLTLNHLKFAYDKTHHFDFDCQFESSKLTLITGDSGAGKTTLLHLIAGFYQPLSGNIAHDETEIHALPPAQRKIAFLFQAHNLFPHLNVWQNIELAFNHHKNAPRDKNPKQDDIINTLTERFKLSDYHQQLPEQLSGGQQQRVALARIFAQIITKKCHILLLDEPFNGLDADLRNELLQEIHQITVQYQLICLFISHHPDEIAPFADEKYHIKNGRIDLIS